MTSKLHAIRHLQQILQFTAKPDVLARPLGKQLSSAEALILFFKKTRKRGKGGKKGKAEKWERLKKRERKGKAKKASARFLSKYGKSCRYPTAHSLNTG